MSQKQKKTPQEDEATVQTAQADDMADSRETPGTEPAADAASAQTDETTQLAAQVATLNEKLLRTMAEYDNFRRRSLKEKESIYPQATANTVAQFVPILDTFERALALECSDAEFKKGVEMIYQNFWEILSKQGVEAFGETGEQFDPDIHNAVMHADDESVGANTITDVFQRGYRLGERIIRHAMVKVVN